MTPIEAKITEATILMNMGDTSTAMAVLCDVFEEDPHNLTAIDTLFLLYYQQKAFETAIQIMSPILEKMPDPDRLSNRGLAYFEMKYFKEAMADYEQALKLDPNHAIAWNNIGDAFKALNRYDECLDALDKSIELDPNFIQPRMNKGIVYSDLGDYDKANEAFESALKLDFSHGDTMFAYSLNLLKMGDYTKGLNCYEKRWDSKVGKEHKRQFKQPSWHRYIDLEDESIFIYAEQGLGDAIQMARFFKDIADKGARVVAETDKPLMELFKTVPGVDEVVIRNGYPTKVVDYQLPIMSLPFQLGITLDNIPYADGYIKANNKKVKGWRKKLGKKTKPRVGIVWGSSSDFQQDHKRSMSFAEFSKCLPEGFEYICLQPFIKTTDYDAVSSRKDVRLFCEDLKDFTETAALIENLDLVVSTCTSVPHLSGAMGKPTWIIIPYSADWRWGISGSTTPWYSSVTLFRQTDMNSWTGILNQVREELTKYK